MILTNHNNFSLYRQRKVAVSALDFDAERFLRSRSRGRDVLFHGTRFAETIVSENRLKYARTGDPVISFTRLPEVAVYWARSERGEPVETANILLLNRQLLKCDYRVFPYHDAMWDKRMYTNFEAEERIELRDIDDLDRYLIDVVTLQLRKRQYFQNPPA